MKTGRGVQWLGLYTSAETRKALGFREYCFTGALTRADVIQTCMYITDRAHADEVGRAHSELFDQVHVEPTDDSINAAVQWARDPARRRRGAVDPESRKPSVSEYVGSD